MCRHPHPTSRSWSRCRPGTCTHAPTLRRHHSLRVTRARHAAQGHRSARRASTTCHLRRVRVRVADVDVEEDLRHAGTWKSRKKWHELEMACRAVCLLHASCIPAPRARASATGNYCALC